MQAFKTIKIFFLKTNFITKLLGWYGLYEFITRGATRARYISSLYMLTHRNKTIRKRLVNELMSQPESAAIITQRLRIRVPFNELANCKSGTLGQLFYQHMQENKLTFFLPLDAELHNDFQYIIHRIITTHDIYHTVLGANITAPHEAKVAAFTYSQITSYAPAIVHVAAGSLHCAVIGNGLVDRGNLNIVRGWLLGKSAKQLFNVDWDAYWHTPIEEVRKTLNIDEDKINTMVQQFYAPERPIVQKISGVPSDLEEHFSDNNCIHDIYELIARDTKGNTRIKVASYKPASPATAVIILGRAMFTTGKYLAKMYSPSLTACLLANGFHVLIPQAITEKNHNTSFDDLLNHTDEHIKFAKSLQPQLPIFLLGHSLSGLTFLAHQGLAASTEKVNGIITLGAATWHRHYIKTENRLFIVRLQLITSLLRLFSITTGFVPARLFGYGDHDEQRAVVQQVTLNNMRHGQWKSLDQTIDYYEALASVQCPVLSVASHKDKYSPVAQVNKLHSYLPNKADEIVTDQCSHMDLGLSIHAWDVWEEIASWVKLQCKKING